MSKSVERVRQVADDLGLEIVVLEMPASTRTAEEAAATCGVELDQIVKSLIFASVGGDLHLFLMAGGSRLDMKVAAKVAGVALERADADQVRSETGFAIGGVAPIGHLSRLPTYMDPRLLDFDGVVAAAGTPRHVFTVSPKALVEATGASLLPR
ncbi:YbaK/EbsC family protein [Pontivivens ytuae]|uniref:YbaK/EbsC family protein n=1 Tax=Pontivivens ytuae TaxID=2789856 RepID=A0A7S9LRM4_9RHOB|nr:YbaK/EbsC family protein [Pontivivens ytuae]QPH53983.1 YbaK/EbsC family protein [Pontivivens ytuae]